MIRILLVAASLALLSASASAQRLERLIDLSVLGWGRIEATPIDTDGTPATEEWAVRSATTNQWRVVAIRDGQLCVGSWFTPTPMLDGSRGPVAEVVTVGGRSKLRVVVPPSQHGVSRFALYSLDTPPCR